MLFAQQDIDRINWKVLAGVRIENGLEQSGSVVLFLPLGYDLSGFVSVVRATLSLKRYVADPLEA